MNQRQAFLVQARSDFEVFDHLRSNAGFDLPECHALHFLQMATEKLAKAVIGSPHEAVRQDTHVAFSRISRSLRRRDYGVLLGYASFDAYTSFLRQAAPLFRRIDELHPGIGPQTGEQRGLSPNVEYPWRTRNSAGAIEWRAPAQFRFGVLQELQSRRGHQLIDFVKRLLNRAELMFSLE